LERPIARTSLCSTRSIGSVGSFIGGFTGVCRRVRERLRYLIRKHGFPSKFRNILVNVVWHCTQSDKGVTLVLGSSKVHYWYFYADHCTWKII
jgi:hypothetical protein